MENLFSIGCLTPKYAPQKWSVFRRLTHTSERLIFIDATFSYILFLGFPTFFLTKKVFPLYRANIYILNFSHSFGNYLHVELQPKLLFLEVIFQSYPTSISNKGRKGLICLLCRVESLIIGVAPPPPLSTPPVHHLHVENHTVTRIGS